MRTRTGVLGSNWAGKSWDGGCVSEERREKKTTRLLPRAEWAGPPWSLEPAAGLTAEDRTHQIGSSWSKKEVPDGKAATPKTSRETPELARCTSKTATKCGCHYQRCK